MSKFLKVRALRSTQGDNHLVYSFFMPGSMITEIADISRVERENKGTLKGFQRKEIKSHVKSIVDYLNQGDVLFPNAIILAFAPEVEFTQSRGRPAEGTIDTGEIGTLAIPFRGNGQPVAWIVDGQQRSLALSQTKNKDIPVPVIGFIAADLDTQREQFILVNKAKPLPSRLINELLPEVDRHLPRDLAIRKVPSVLCNLLNLDPKSPFYKLIKRASTDDEKSAVIVDTAVMSMITKSLNNPLGALSQFKGLGEESSDLDAMYKILVLYWSAVKQVFPKAWGLPATKSRLMHGAGIKAMGVLMDRVVPRAIASIDPAKQIMTSMKKIAPRCCWASGTWEDLGLDWNDIQNVPKHVKILSEQLLRLDMMASQEKAR
jgi:DGQHR domain-containing protein